MKNESRLDRMLRAIAGILVLSIAYFWTSGNVSIALYVVGAILLFTAATGFCLLYKPFGFSTLKKK